MKKILALVLAIVMTLSLSACGGNDSTASDNGETRIVKDRNGTEYSIPTDVERIIGATPAVTEIIAGLGEADKLVAIDNYSTDVEGIDADLPTFDTMAPDIEMLIGLEPQVLIASSNSQVSDDDPYKTLTEQGVTVIYMDNSVSLDGIMQDITFIADIVGNSEKGTEMTTSIKDKMTEISDIAATIPDDQKKSVYFEISPAPDLCTFGTGNFLDEILTLVGAKNCFGDKEGWITPSEEAIIGQNPDVILTNVNYTQDDQVKFIKARSGWEGINAVKNGEVYMIDANASSRPTQNIVKAMDQIAQTIYPDLYK